MEKEGCFALSHNALTIVSPKKFHPKTEKEGGVSIELFCSSTFTSVNFSAIVTFKPFITHNDTQYKK